MSIGDATRIIAAVCLLCINLYILYSFFSSMGLDLHDLIERKKTGKHPFPVEKKSRERVRTALDDASLSVKDKCLFLNNELGRVMDSVFVSREWKDEIFNTTSVIMKENGLTIADFF